MPPEMPRLPSRGSQHGLIFGLIRMRLSAFSGIRGSVLLWCLMQATDVGGAWRTRIPSPEKRMVGGSTSPLVTTANSVTVVFDDQRSIFVQLTVQFCCLHSPLSHAGSKLRRSWLASGNGAVRTRCGCSVGKIR